MGFPTPIFSWTPRPGAVPFDFNGTTYSLGTYSRASTGLSIYANGVWGTYPAGVLRDYWTPDTLEYKGKLIEESRVNLAFYSEDLTNAYWSKTGATVTGDAMAAPIGTGSSLMDKLVEDTSTGAHSFSRASFVITANWSCGFSFHFAKAERTKCKLSVVGSSGSGYLASFDGDTETMTVTQVGASSSAPVYGWEKMADGSYRLWLFCVVNATDTAATATAYLADATGANTYTGVSGYGAYFWGMQFEVGAIGPSSYYPTTTAAATRSADSLVITLANIKDGYGNSLWQNVSECTLIARVYNPYPPRASSAIVSLQDSSVYNNSVGVYYGAAGSVAGFVYSTAAPSGSQASSALNPYPVRGDMIVGVGAKKDDFVFGMDGAIVLDTAGNFPVGMTQLRMGSWETGSSFSHFVLRHIALWNRKLTTEQFRRLIYAWR